MAKTIYDKPVRALIRDMVQEFGLQPGQVFTTGRVLSWFQTNYPKLQPAGIRAHLVMMSTNDRSRLHHAIKPEDDLFFKVDTGQFRLYEPGKDPAPIHEFMTGDVAEEEMNPAVEEDDEEAPPSTASEFLLEKDLQLYLAKNLHVIEPGLRLYEGEQGKGYEFQAGGRRIDILAVDSSGALVVLELKVSKAYDRVIGQLLRYVNWIRQNLAEPGQKVRGMIISRTLSDDLQLACASVADIELYEYALSVTIKKSSAIDLSF